MLGQHTGESAGSDGLTPASRGWLLIAPLRSHSSWLRLGKSVSRTTSWSSSSKRGSDTTASPLAPWPGRPARAAPDPPPGRRLGEVAHRTALVRSFRDKPLTTSRSTSALPRSGATLRTAAPRSKREGACSARTLIPLRPRHRPIPAPGQQPILVQRLPAQAEGADLHRLPLLRRARRHQPREPYQGHAAGLAVAVHLPNPAGAALAAPHPQPRLEPSSSRRFLWSSASRSSSSRCRASRSFPAPPPFAPAARRAGAGLFPSVRAPWRDSLPRPGRSPRDRRRCAGRARPRARARWRSSTGRLRASCRRAPSAPVPARPRRADSAP